MSAGDDFTRWTASVRGAVLVATSGGERAGEAQAALAENWPGIIHTCSLDPNARAALRDLIEPLAAADEQHEWAHWIRVILTVLDQEPFVAIEPATGLGITGRMSGVVDNFQLNVLLMDQFPLPPDQSGDATRRVSEMTAAVARGDGPQQIDAPVEGTWNLCTYRALKGGQIEAPADSRATTWIWNEGIPADIPVLDEHRVILLGDLPYARSWANCRTFPGLRASLDASPLDADGVTHWLQRIETA